MLPSCHLKKELAFSINELHTKWGCHKQVNGHENVTDSIKIYTHLWVYSLHSQGSRRILGPHHTNLDLNSNTGSNLHHRCTKPETYDHRHPLQKCHISYLLSMVATLYLKTNHKLKFSHSNIFFVKLGPSLLTWAAR